MKNQDNKTCGQSCGCHTQPKKTEDKDTQEQLNQSSDNKNSEEQDPTKFGDWQVNGRAIDF